MQRKLEVVTTVKGLWSMILYCLGLHSIKNTMNKRLLQFIENKASGFIEKMDYKYWFIAFIIRWLRDSQLLYWGGLQENSRREGCFNSVK